MEYHNDILRETLKHSTEVVGTSTSFLFLPHASKSMPASPVREANMGTVCFHRLFVACCSDQ